MGELSSIAYFVRSDAEFSSARDTVPYLIQWGRQRRAFVDPETHANENGTYHMPAIVRLKLL